MDLGLKNRVALVAASSQGIGLATAQAFAAEGCRVAMCARNQKTLAAAADGIRKRYSAEVFAEACDVTESAAVEHFVSAIAAKFGSVDICVANAGGPPAKGFLATTPDDWRGAIAANFLSAVYFVRSVIPHMQRARWGRIVTITSITTKQPVARSGWCPDEPAMCPGTPLRDSAGTVRNMTAATKNRTAIMPKTTASIVLPGDLALDPLV